MFKTHELKELQVPFLSQDDMWRRLEKYVKGASGNEPYASGEVAATPGGNSIKFGGHAIRHKGAAPEKAQPKNRPQRTQSPRRDERVTSNQDAPGKEHLLPKRKRTGVTRQRDGSEMEPPN